MIEVLMYQCESCGMMHMDKRAVSPCKKCGSETCEACCTPLIGSKVFLNEWICDKCQPIKVEG
jgi:hypothetical protein